MAVGRPAIVEIDEPADGRLFALGDVHGCYDALMAVESKIIRSVKRSGLSQYKLISVGDLCDRGPDTKKVIEHFVAGKKANTHEMVVGNHEMFFLMAFAGLRPDLLERAGVELTWYHRALLKMYKNVSRQVESWRVNGGESVFRSYDADIGDLASWEQVPSSHLLFLFEAPLVILTSSAVISHAVMHSGDLDVLKAQDDAAGNPAGKRVLEAVHRCLWEREFAVSRIDAKRRHVSGHTPVENVRREAKLGVIQIDTGAVYGRRLTAINLSNFRTLGAPSNFRYRRPQKDLY